MQRRFIRKKLVLLLLILCMVLCGCGTGGDQNSSEVQADSENFDSADNEELESFHLNSEELDSLDRTTNANAGNDAEQSEASTAEAAEPVIYTFLQGQKSYENGKIWSGAWCNHEEGGQAFGHFGCSFCCMANVYDTLSPYACSPLDVLIFTKEATSYDPSAGSTALGWQEMKQVMELAGISCELWNKDQSYEEFAQKLEKNRTAIVLVCSSNDDSIWQNEPGHYVNIWDCGEETGEVFLADPASPTRNRTRVSLKNVYDALKTSSSYQYLLVTDYEEAADSWKKDGIAEDWYRDCRR